MKKKKTKANKFVENNTNRKSKTAKNLALGEKKTQTMVEVKYRSKEVDLDAKILLDLEEIHSGQANSLTPPPANVACRACRCQTFCEDFRKTTLVVARVSRVLLRPFRCDVGERRGAVVV